MTLEIRILNDDGSEAVRFSTDAAKPYKWSTPYERPLDDGKYLVYGFIYAPQTVLKPLKPNR